MAYNTAMAFPRFNRNNSAAMKYPLPVMFGAKQPVQPLQKQLVKKPALKLDIKA